jgi:hypothetical protein
LKNALAYYKASVVAANLAILGFAPGLCKACFCTKKNQVMYVWMYICMLYTTQFFKRIFAPTEKLALTRKQATIDA